MKKLYKIEHGKKLCGVCGGIAEYFDIDVALVRLLTVILSLFWFSGVIVYIVAAVILPNKSDIDTNF
ncbi:MAG: PspC domain-containing protein [Clostridiales bacterium]|nr:PspC domain-containing protein [Clostridiales bacterium]